MDKIVKLFKKISEKDRKVILATLEKLVDEKQRSNLDIKKIEDTDFLRLRQGRFRIIFHHENGSPIVDSIKARNENTYNF
jgi:mRNA-degrading endonuclease RelE of RelBE toxin-antitoxin system